MKKASGSSFFGVAMVGFWLLIFMCIGVALLEYHPQPVTAFLIAVGVYFLFGIVTCIFKKSRYSGIYALFTTIVGLTVLLIFNADLRNAIFDVLNPNTEIEYTPLPRAPITGALIGLGIVVILMRNEIISLLKGLLKGDSD